MGANKLKTAVLGLKDEGSLLLEAASKVDYLQIQAVADKDAKLAERLAGQYNCSAYDDYRQFIIQNEFDCLLVAAGMYSCDEYVRMAMKKKFNIFKLPPLARNFEEASGFVRLAEGENIKFAVANPSRFAQSYLALRQFLNDGSIEQVFLITAFCTVVDDQNARWRTDPKLAGGGALLRDCYEIIDQIVYNFATPQQVYALNTNTAGDRQQRLYLTEDIALVTMKFADTSFGNLITGKLLGPKQTVLKIYGKNKILTVDDSRFVVSDGLGHTSGEFEYDDGKLACMTKALTNFARSIISPDENKLCSDAKENLKTMAVIESAYLSARTSMPEEPARILQMAQTEPTNLWPGQK